MVWRGDRDYVDVVAIEQTTEIRDLVDLAAVALLELVCATREYARVAIAKRHEFVLEAIDVALTTAVEANDGDPDLTVDILARCLRDARQQAAGRRDTGRL